MQLRETGQSRNGSFTKHANAMNMGANDSIPAAGSSCISLN